MFPRPENKANKKQRIMKKEWQVKVNPEKTAPCTLDALKFINDTVRANFLERPWPEDLIDHPYLSVDVNTTPSV